MAIDLENKINTMLSKFDIGTFIDSSIGEEFNNRLNVDSLDVGDSINDVTNSIGNISDMVKGSIDVDELLDAIGIKKMDEYIKEGIDVINKSGSLEDKLNLEKLSSIKGKLSSFSISNSFGLGPISNTLSGANDSILEYVDESANYTLIASVIGMVALVKALLDTKSIFPLSSVITSILGSVGGSIANRYLNNIIPEIINKTKGVDNDGIRTIRDIVSDTKTMKKFKEASVSLSSIDNMIRSYDDKSFRNANDDGSDDNSGYIDLLNNIRSSINLDRLRLIVPQLNVGSANSRTHTLEIENNMTDILDKIDDIILRYSLGSVLCSELDLAVGVTEPTEPSVVTVVVGGSTVVPDTVVDEEPIIDIPVVTPIDVTTDDPIAVLDGVDLGYYKYITYDAYSYPADKYTLRVYYYKDEQGVELPNVEIVEGIATVVSIPIGGHDGFVDTVSVLSDEIGGTMTYYEDNLLAPIEKALEAFEADTINSGALGSNITEIRATPEYQVIYGPIEDVRNTYKSLLFASENIYVLDIIKTDISIAERGIRYDSIDFNIYIGTMKVVESLTVELANALSNDKIVNLLKEYGITEAYGYTKLSDYVDIPDIAVRRYRGSLANSNDRARNYSGVRIPISTTNNTNIGV